MRNAGRQEQMMSRDEGYGREGVDLIVLGFLYSSRFLLGSLLGALNLGAEVLSGGGTTSVELSQLSSVELGGLEHLDLADVDVLQGEDTVALPLDHLAD